LEADIKSDPDNPENAGKLNELYHLQVDYDPVDKSASKKNTMDLPAGSHQVNFTPAGLASG
jgi:hypothetical protein